MTVVSTKEFNTNQDKYFDLALEERVYIQKDDNMFLLAYKDDVNDMNVYHDASVYEEVLEPDDDFYKSISADEFRKRLSVVLDKVDKKYANKCK